MTVKLLTEQHLVFLNLKGGCTGLSESTLVKMSHCWKSHVTAQIVSLSWAGSYCFSVPKYFYLNPFQSSHYFCHLLSLLLMF